MYPHGSGGSHMGYPRDDRRHIEPVRQRSYIDHVVEGLRAEPTSGPFSIGQQCPFTEYGHGTTCNTIG